MRKACRQWEYDSNGTISKYQEQCTQWLFPIGMQHRSQHSIMQSILNNALTNAFNFQLSTQSKNMAMFKKKYSTKYEKYIGTCVVNVYKI
jgi:hypothetical protein